jgi:archaellum component FlaC
MTNSNNTESRLDRLETNQEALQQSIADLRQSIAETRQSIAETNRNVSDLNSTVATLADLISIQQQDAQQTDSRIDQLVAEAAADRQQAALDRAENNRRFEESRQQADRDRALMLQLIQSIAQGGNGGGQQ